MTKKKDTIKIITTKGEPSFADLYHTGKHLCVTKETREPIGDEKILYGITHVKSGVKLIDVSSLQRAKKVMKEIEDNYGDGLAVETLKELQKFARNVEFRNFCMERDEK